LGGIRPRQNIINIQVIDGINIDEITNIGWVKDIDAAASLTISNFISWIEAHKDEITALQIFYDQPYRRRELTYSMIKDLYEKIKMEQPMLAPMQVWRAYEQLKEAIQGLEKERDFYFSKLRDIELLLQTAVEQDPSLETDENGLVKNIQTILYSTEEGFEIPDLEANGAEEPETF